MENLLKEKAPEINKDSLAYKNAMAVLMVESRLSLSQKKHFKIALRNTKLGYLLEFLPPKN
jgi:hypothetical protein